MIEIPYISAIIGGLLTFLAPCTLPLIPAYLGFLAGSPSVSESKHSQQRRIFINAILFTLAFSLVFIFFGLASGAIGAFFILHRAVISKIGGILVVIFGLSMLGVFEIPQLMKWKTLPRFFIPGNPLSAFLLGLLFALGWSPCLGPILGTILVLAGTGGTALHGALLLLLYSLGLAIPFLLIAGIYGTSYRYINTLTRILPYVNKVGGVMLMLIGALLIMGDFGLLSTWTQELWGNTWYTSLMDHM